jgi:predicted ATPase
MAMPVKTIEVERFSVFHKLKVDFSPGINVFIGENGTGKSHLMKLMYSMLKSQDESIFANPPPEFFTAELGKKLAAVFKPDDGQVGRLVSRNAEHHAAKVTLTRGTDSPRVLQCTLSDSGPWCSLSEHDSLKSGQLDGTALFIPSREALAMYEGFIAAYDNRELSFDETYYDLCKALSGSKLRGSRMEEAAALLDELERIIGGKVRLRGNRFYLQSEKLGDVEAHLLAEGVRKLASIAHLVASGALSKNTILFWDEPEANLNPRVIPVVVHVLRQLAYSGAQVFVATHDYLLTNELAMAVDYDVKPVVPIKFFGFSRSQDSLSVEVQGEDRLYDLQDNPILHEFAAQYDRERQLMFPSETDTNHE